MSELRYCYSCHQKKELSEYTKRADSHDGIDFYCKQCKRDQNSKYYLQQKKDLEKQQKKSTKFNAKIQRDKYKQYETMAKSTGCCICGEKTFCCLDFHHIDPNTKEFTIARRQLYSVDKIINEMKKCAIVCSNCHRKIHNGIISGPTTPLSLPNLSNCPCCTVSY